MNSKWEYKNSVDTTCSEKLYVLFTVHLAHFAYINTNYSRI